MRKQFLWFLMGAAGIALAPLAPSLSGQWPAAGRGTEKKDLRVVITWWDQSEAATAQKVGRELAPVIDSIASGAKLTKADAARTAGGSMPLAEWLSGVTDRARRAPGRGWQPVLLSVTAPSAARQDAMACNRPGCTPDCSFCFDLLDLDPVHLTFYPEEDPELHMPSGFGGSGSSSGAGSSGGPGGSGGSGGSGGAGGAGGSGGSGSGGSGGSGGSSGGSGGGHRMAAMPRRNYLIVIVNGQQRTPEQIRQLVLEAYQMLKTAPVTERIVIKTKSSPP